jgi:hypothetical protein
MLSIWQGCKDKTADRKENIKRSLLGGGVSRENFDVCFCFFLWREKGLMG